MISQEEIERLKRNQFEAREAFRVSLSEMIEVHKNNFINQRPRRLGATSVWVEAVRASIFSEPTANVMLLTQKPIDWVRQQLPGLKVEETSVIKEDKKGLSFKQVTGYLISKP